MSYHKITYICMKYQEVVLMIDIKQHIVYGVVELCKEVISKPYLSWKEYQHRVRITDLIHFKNECISSFIK